MNVICDCLRKHQNGGICDCLDDFPEPIPHEHSDWDNWEEEEVEEDEEKPKSGRITKDSDDWFVH